MKLSIVSTLYRSAPHLREFHARALAAAEKLTPDIEIILVNDGSPDNAQEVAEEVCAADPRVGVVELSRNFGHHKAMMTGLQHARGDLVFLIDCDLEEPPELLAQFHGIMEEKQADVVYGVQERRKGGWFERWSGSIYYRIFNLLCTERIPENLLTARLMTREYVRSLLRHREREIVIGGLWVITGYRQVPITVKKHSRGETTYTLARKMALLVNHLTSFSNRPLVYIFALGCFILGLSLAMATYLIIRRLVSGLLEGWASVMVSLWFLGGLSIFCMGILGIYLSKMFLEVKRRPYTIVRSRHGLLASRRRKRRRRSSGRLNHAPQVSPIGKSGERNEDGV